MAEITDKQAAFLQAEMGRTPNGPKSVAGLVRKGLLRHRWGADPYFGYEVTDAGKRALLEWGKRKAESKTPALDGRKHEEI